MIYGYCHQQFNQGGALLRGTPTVPTHMVRARNGVLEEGSRASHTSGGCQGDTACRNSMLKSVDEEKCAEDSGLLWSHPPIITLPAPTSTPAVDISWFQKKSERRWIPTMRRSTLRGGRSPNSLRWETYAPPFVRKSLVIFLSFFQNIYLPKHVSLGKTGVHVASHWLHLIADDICDCAQLGEATLSSWNPPF